MLNLIMPMAGGGTRFKNDGINIPKPLIEINGKPFFFWATQSILKFVNIKNLVFVVLKEHIEKYSIDKEILKYYSNAKIQIIDNVLNGAVFTCLEGIKQIVNNEPILFNDCDHAFLSSQFYKYCMNQDFSDADGALLTFYSNEERYSYIALDEKNNVIRTMEKKVISDKAICGAYYFKNKNIFKISVEEYINNCIYEEYFISGVYNIMIKNKLLVKYFPTDLHISFGTPEEYEESKKYNFKEFI
ncbi:glycosyltransferase family 2 protein [Fusobacterium sp. 1001295B_180824_G3]|uniref:glycosyltransferase family 2 protein n=1 Tax=Fusobacterium sp. 1001295B_180824_G3 TaxID=2787123 RepID=UPI00189BF099|nr:glycosyltransferase family 2 protein [Fusobacterium sp. 1001295B_180824_G3]